MQPANCVESATPRLKGCPRHRLVPDTLMCSDCHLLAEIRGHEQALRALNATLWARQLHEFDKHDVPISEWSQI